MPADFINRIHLGDCVAGLNALPAEVVDLAFADPPFNIGYKYDVYDDRRENEHYLDWSREWITAVHRVLKPNGSFWLAIGDEYAAELKVMSQEIGFHSRSWVVWYYTFGVNCKNKFTRSHAHLFYFVKDKESFTFRGDAPENRIPSARQLVYNDSRANPKGRLPDDTWILRPQDMADCFQAEEDTWYFPRVAGTFKERAGFHGCQMPEQLLGRIIRCCSNEGDLVLDPFSGSATTLVTAKKLGRDFVGFELSPDYAERGGRRAAEAEVGTPLVGSADPTRSAPRTPGLAQEEEAPPNAVVATEAASELQPAESSSVSDTSSLDETGLDETGPSETLSITAHTDPESSVAMDDSVEKDAAAEVVEPIVSTTDQCEESLEKPAAEALVEVISEPTEALVEVATPDPQRDLIEAFRRACGGYSADRVMADPALQEAFLDHCRALDVPGDACTWNSTLFRLRKAGKLKAVPTTTPTELTWVDCEPYAYAAEIALVKVTAAHPEITLDDMLCDPLLAAEFDKLAQKFGGSKKAFEYRWSALKLRKEAKQLRVRADELKQVEPAFGTPLRIAGKKWEKAIPDAPGLYLLLNSEGDRLYAGASTALRTRLVKQVATSRLLLYDRTADLRVAVWPVDRPITDLLALQLRLVVASRPRLNVSFIDSLKPLIDVASKQPQPTPRLKVPHRRHRRARAGGSG